MSVIQRNCAGAALNPVEFQEEEEEKQAEKEKEGEVEKQAEEEEEALDRLFEECVERVGRLQRRRDELVQELRVEEERMQEDAQTLRLQLEQIRSSLDRAQLHKLRLQEEVMCIKRKLFTVARDCIQSQVTMAAQRYEVDQFTFIQEDLQSQLLQRMQELCELREQQRSRLASLREKLQCPSRPRASSDLSHCRRASGDFARFASADMRALQQRYETRLALLLRWKRMSEEALKSSRELTLQLKTHLHPLIELTRRLQLQKQQTLHSIHLMEEERSNHTHLHREKIWSLEEKLRELQTAVQIQIHTNTQLAELKECLKQKSMMFRRCLGFSEQSDTENQETEDV